MEVSIRSNLKEYLNHHPIADQLFMKLYNIGELYLIGGVLREFLETGDIENVRDIDLVISTKKVGQFHEICAKYHTKRILLADIKLTAMTLQLIYGELKAHGHTRKISSNVLKKIT